MRDFLSSIGLVRSSVESVNALDTPIVCSIDIETLDTQVTAKILSIGLCVGNIMTGEVLDNFYVRIEHDQTGRTVSRGTMGFWDAQKTKSPDAYAECFDEGLTRITLKDALIKMNGFIQSVQHKYRDIRMIGNGPEFDQAIVSHAMQSMGMEQQWRHRANDSHRTFVYMGRLLLGIDPKFTLAFKGRQHHALDDARHEFEYSHFIVKAFVDRLASSDRIEVTYKVSAD